MSTSTPTGDFPSLPSPPMTSTEGMVLRTDNSWTTVLNLNITIGIYTFGDDSINLPKQATEQAACFDLEFRYVKTEPTKIVSGYDFRNRPVKRHANDDGSLTIYPLDRLLFPTSMIFNLPTNTSMRVHPRSGLSLKQGLTLINCEGIIDSDYVEQLMIPLVNFSYEKISIAEGTRLAQAEIIDTVNNLRISSFNRITFKPDKKTSRDGGFGSTGEK